MSCNPPLERFWPSVILNPISVSNSIIAVSSTSGLKVKQKISLRLGANVDEFEIKRVLSDTQIQVGPHGPGTTIHSISNPVTYNGGILEMQTQNRNPMGPEIFWRACYSEEPTLAIRSILVDEFGCYIDSVEDANGINRLAVDIGPIPVDVDLRNPKNIQVVNTPILLANTEGSFTLPANITRFIVRVRDGKADLKLAYTSGQSGIEYFKVYRGTVFSSGDLDTGAYNVYYQSEKPNVVLEWMLFTM